ncbi:hypothetical protein [Polaromonas sp.]|uniref:hypothetical protein n=1 Tax=Polaromonas sp. TaxID=1869339 RepID=UPI002FC96446
MINQIAQIAAFAVLLAGPVAFGLLGKPTEMSLCILAAAIGLAFSNIEKLKRFKGAGFEAEMLEKRVEVMMAKEAEPAPEAASIGITVKAYGLDEATRRVVKALGNSKYTWRTAGGIAQETGQTTSTVKKALDWLSINDLTVQAGAGKVANWGLSEEGRNLYNSISASSDAA